MFESSWIKCHDFRWLTNEATNFSSFLASCRLILAFWELKFEILNVFFWTIYYNVWARKRKNFMTLNAKYCFFLLFLKLLFENWMFSYNLCCFYEGFDSFDHLFEKTNWKKLIRIKTDTFLLRVSQNMHKTEKSQYFILLNVFTSMKTAP